MASTTLQRLLHRLRELRRVHGLSQEQFVEASGISYKYYQAVEAGRKPNLRLSTLERLGRAYGIEVYQLVGPDTPRTRSPARVGLKMRAQGARKVRVR